MENKNVFTMKQPELGRKIVNLRKQQGLTQEELVAQCNINVRTIQRIEAGEVTPRSYTLKSILHVLGAEFDNLEEEKESVKEVDAKKLINKGWKMVYLPTICIIFLCCFILFFAYGLKSGLLAWLISSIAGWYYWDFSIKEWIRIADKEGATKKRIIEISKLGLLFVNEKTIDKALKD